MIGIMYQTSLPPPMPLEKCGEKAEDLQFVLLNPTARTTGLVVNEIRDLADKNEVVPAEHVAGFWYGHKGPTGSTIYQQPSPDEKVIYHLHGKGRD